MSPAGRKPLAGQVKNGRLIILVNESERERLDHAASVAGKPTSTWARDELLRLADAVAKKPAKKK